MNIDYFKETCSFNQLSVREKKRQVKDYFVKKGCSLFSEPNKKVLLCSYYRTCTGMLDVSSIDFDTWRGTLFLAKYQAVDSSAEPRVF